jgi:hypothetical protein
LQLRRDRDRQRLWVFRPRGDNMNGQPFEPIRHTLPPDRVKDSDLMQILRDCYCRALMTVGNTTSSSGAYPLERKVEVVGFEYHGAYYRHIAAQHCFERVR